MPRIRLKSGELRDEIMQPQYDNYDLLNTVSPLGLINNFFSAVQGKTLDETNLRQNNMLEAATSFRCTGLAFVAQNHNPANIGVLPTLMDYSSLVWTVGEKIYWTGNTCFAASRIYLQSAIAAGPQLAADAPAVAPVYHDLQQSYGNPAPRAVVFSRLHTVDINPLQTFKVAWTVSSTLTAAQQAQATPVADTATVSGDIRFFLILYGLLRRASQ